MSDLSAVRSGIVITLGEEVWNSLEETPGITVDLPARSFDEVAGRYGEKGSIRMGTYEGERLPLVHPGIIGRRSGWDDIPTAWRRLLD